MPRTSAAEAERLRIQEETIARQQEALAAERTAREDAEARERASREALDAARSAPKGEDAAERLEAELRGMNGARVLREGSKVVVVITDAFEPGSDVLKPSTEVRTAILSTAAAILRHPETRVSVVGHSDGQPINKTAAKWKDNVELSRARAASVAKAMGASGVGDERLAVDGRGSAAPRGVPARPRADRAKNRRGALLLSVS
jgi:flagellar motor protein MotB